MHKSINPLFEVEELAEEGNVESSLTDHYYHVVSENFHHVDLGEYHTFGIQVTKPDNVRVVHDISTCNETVTCMASLFNRHQLSSIHLYEAVENMLASIQ